MTFTTAMIDDVRAKSDEVVVALSRDPKLQSYVDTQMPLPKLFHGGGEIRLVLIGQDPTVENIETRKKVNTVLMLDRRGHLSNFISNLCAKFGLTLANVYATNCCKNFFNQTPTQIKKKHNIDVITLASQLWLPVLKQELSWLPKATVFTLGEPVLSVLVRSGFAQNVKSYWGYRQGWNDKGFNDFRQVSANESAIDRSFFPFVHLNTSRKSKSGAFYEARLKSYVEFVQNQIRRESHAWAS